MLVCRTAVVQDDSPRLEPEAEMREGGVEGGRGWRRIDTEAEEVSEGQDFMLYSNPKEQKYVPRQPSLEAAHVYELEVGVLLQTLPAPFLT